MKNHFMPMYWGDYLRDTADLTYEEHGVYLLLLAHHWNTGKAIDINQLPLAGSKGKLKKISFKILERFFTKIEKGTFENKRVLEEMAKAKDRAQRASERGKKGGRPTAKKESYLEPEPEPSVSLSQRFTLIRETGEQLREDEWLYENLRDSVDRKKMLDHPPTLAALVAQSNKTKRTVDEWLTRPIAERMAACALVEAKPGLDNGVLYGIKAMAERWEPFTKWLKLMLRAVEENDLIMKSGG